MRSFFFLVFLSEFYIFLKIPALANRNVIILNIRLPIGTLNHRERVKSLYKRHLYILKSNGAADIKNPRNYNEEEAPNAESLRSLGSRWEHWRPLVVEPQRNFLPLTPWRHQSRAASRRLDRLTPVGRYTPLRADATSPPNHWAFVLACQSCWLRGNLQFSWEITLSPLYLAAQSQKLHSNVDGFTHALTHTHTYMYSVLGQPNIIQILLSIIWLWTVLNFACLL